MSVNGINGYSKLDAYNAYQNSAPKKAEESPAKDDTKAAKEESGVVYEPSAAAQKYTQNAELVQKLLSEANSYKDKLTSYVQELLTGQGNAAGMAGDEMWKFLASGNYTVSAAAKEEAQAAIAEGGYWSVEKTSDRILDMAKALTGGDPSKIEDMRSAVEKGFKEATKAWGRDLPEISSKTYDAVMQKFDDWAASAQI